ncbi:hypothetical protein [Burkholderia sp. RF4-BP95]|uniref:hypothetical protein n=1 Tax=Burkholderia sp. RF4-BP95 TaxID=1637845 RepID=UPI00075C9C4A|nr:hypothetical protein [Burkholderia sp. RF4-BP95]KUY84080.1 hypothetical protein WS46_08290 [Burkholderia sp. RF4-BP95]
MSKDTCVNRVAGSTEPARRRLARVLIVGLTLQGSLAVGSPDAPLDASVERGARLFDGGNAMRGRLDGHAEILPPTASRCINCHVSSPQRGALAPLLDASTLRVPQQRRGGPPSVYSRETFCETLRTGVDPAYVTLKSTMPRFDASDQQCGDLWNYLTTETR